LIITNEAGESIDLYTDEGIRLVSLDGIGYETSIKSMEVHGQDGALYQDNQLKPRNMPIIVRYRGPAWKHEQHKNRLTRLIANKQILTIQNVTDNIDVYIKGYVEWVRTPPNIHPMNTHISITCTDPYWKDSNSRTVVISGTELCWRFPFTIPDKGMMFERTRSALITPVYNNGSVESGAVFTLKAVTACTNPKLLHVDTGEYIQVTVDMVAGDVLEICTKFDEKSIYFTHEGERIDYYNYRVYGSTFFQLRTGKNSIKYTVDSGVQHALEITCDFDTKFGGI